MSGHTFLLCPPLDPINTSPVVLHQIMQICMSPPFPQEGCRQVMGDLDTANPRHSSQFPADPSPAGSSPQSKVFFGSKLTLCMILRFAFELCFPFSVSPVSLGAELDL